MAEPAIVLHVVYRSPRDYPGQFVVRRHGLVFPEDGGPAQAVVESEPLYAGPDLDCARRVLPLWRRNVTSPNDDPAILEVWL